MRVTPAKLGYLSRSLARILSVQENKCPNCDSREWAAIESKYFVTRLVECNRCLLRFRIPTDTADHNESFYQESYAQGFTTDLPDPTSLKKLLDSCFQGHEKDFSRFIGLFAALGVAAPSTICDFGCSWGYGSWQFMQRGYDVVGYEISRPRAQYARELLNIRVEDRLEQFRNHFDVFFSSHVLEHVPSINDVWQLAKSVLKPRGIFAGVTPNGSESRRKTDPQMYSANWGNVHPAFLTDTFYQQLFGKLPFLLLSTPFDADGVSHWDKQSQQTGQMCGSELLAIAIMDE